MNRRQAIVGALATVGASLFSKTQSVDALKQQTFTFPYANTVQRGSSMVLVGEPGPERWFLPNGEEIVHIPERPKVLVYDTYYYESFEQKERNYAAYLEKRNSADYLLARSFTPSSPPYNVAIVLKKMNRETGIFKGIGYYSYGEFNVDWYEVPNTDRWYLEKLVAMDLTVPQRLDSDYVHI